MSIWKRLATMKVREVPEYLKSTVTLSNARNSFQTWATNYRKTYIDTGSDAPVFHVIVYGMAFSYIVSWPQQYAHHKAEEAARISGGQAHH